MKKIILPVLTLILLLFYIFSFVDFNSFRKNEFKLSNSEVTEFSIKKNDSKITFFNDNNVWKAEKDYIIFPVEKKLIDNILIKFNMLNKCIDEYQYDNSKNSYGFIKTEEIELFVKKSDGFCNIFKIGKSDFSLINRYIYIYQYENKKYEDKIYKINFNFEELLHTESRFWIDPYFIPKNIFDSKEFDIQKIQYNYNSKKSLILPGKTVKINNSDVDIIQKLSDLRHGAILNSKNTKNPVLTMDIEFSDNNELEIIVKPYSETDYSVEYFIKNKNYGQFNHSVLISNWTFNTIIELFN